MATKTKSPKMNAKKPAPSKAASVRTAKGEKVRKAAIEEIASRIEVIGTAAAASSEHLALNNATQEPAQPPDVRAGGPEDACATPSATTGKNSSRGRLDKDTEKTGKHAKPEKSKRFGGLDAAAQVLAKAGKPMSCSEIVEVMLERKLWTTTGKTPQATIYAGIIREVAAKGCESRFRKTDRGMFEVTGLTKGRNA